KNKLIPTDANTNDAFRALAFECVSKFQDAHTRVVMQGSVAPGEAKVAYLGFLSSRTTYESKTKVIDPMGVELEVQNTVNALRVSRILPTTAGTAFDLKVGDLITQINGQSVDAYLTSELIKYDNNGQ